jgi:hypothetical protein
VIRPTPPIELNGAAERILGARVDVSEDVIEALGSVCPIVDDEAELAESSRDWWPLALHWSLVGLVPRLGGGRGRHGSIDRQRREGAGVLGGDADAGERFLRTGNFHDAVSAGGAVKGRLIPHDDGHVPAGRQ